MLEVFSRFREAPGDSHRRTMEALGRQVGLSIERERAESHVAVSEARTRAVVEERLGAYRATVINAIKEVEDALISEQKQRDYIVALDQRLEAARLSYGESINRYRNGLIEYTTVLIQLNTLQALERDRVAAQYDLLQYRINLYRALGGTWPNELTYSKNEDNQ